MSTPKKLSLTVIDKQYKKDFSTQEKHVLSNGYYIITQKKFKKKDIQSLLIDYIEITEQMKKQDITSDVLRSVTFIYFILILKHFTNLHDDIPTDIEKMVIVYEQLDEYGLIEEIFSKFEQSEIDKIRVLIDQVSKNSKVFETQIGELLLKEELNKIIDSSDEEVVQDGE